MNKLTSALTVLLLGNGALACPDLSGTYLCAKSEFHPESLYTFTQQPHAADWLFKLESKVVGSDAGTSFQFLTDGFERETTEAKSGMKLLVTASCGADFLLVTGQANLDKPQRIKFSEKLSLTPENNLRNESLNIRGETEIETCVRQAQ